MARRRPSSNSGGCVSTFMSQWKQARDVNRESCPSDVQNYARIRWGKLQPFYCVYEEEQRAFGHWYERSVYDEWGLASAERRQWKQMASHTAPLVELNIGQVAAVEQIQATAATYIWSGY